MPWININFNETKEVASTIEYNEMVKSHLTFGAECDLILEWFIKTEVKTLAEIAENSTKWCSNHSIPIVKTGNREDWCANNIYDFAGNVSVWTQEQNRS